MNRKSNTPKRERLKRPARLVSAASWIKEYKGKNLVAGYAKWFGVDKICAINELKIIGVVIPENLEHQIIESVKARIIEKRKTREKKKIENEKVSPIESDENFAYIIGYTSGGAPYGITHEEMNYLETGHLAQTFHPPSPSPEGNEEQELRQLNIIELENMDEELPF